MTGPPWLAGGLAALALAIAMFSAARLAASRMSLRPGEADADGAHALMGVATAGMLVPRLAILPSSLWEGVFTLGAAWFGWRAARLSRARPAGPGGDYGRLAAAARYCRYPVPHLIDCAAMVYVLWAVPAMAGGGQPASGGGMGAMGAAAAGARYPVIGLALAVGVCGYVVWLLDRLPALQHPALASAGPVFPDRDRYGAGFRPEPGTITMPRPALLAPRAATCCKIAMGVAMGVMLIDVL